MARKNLDNLRQLLYDLFIVHFWQTYSGGKKPGGFAKIARTLTSQYVWIYDLG
jgi:hypothetical protein